MSGRSAGCPQCGAPVVFRWSSAVQTICPYCKSVLVRTDVDLERLGEAADLPPDASPIQIMTEGKFNGKSFQVIGRIRYRYELGSWNEWHIVFNDGTNGWLSDAQLEYAISYWVTPPSALPPEDRVSRGQTFQWQGVMYVVSVVTDAEYVGIEGELPFKSFDEGKMKFADLRTTDARFGTIDYSDDQPLLYLGQAVTFESLELKGLREFEGWEGVR